jgi:hypothetical protein
LGFDGCWRKATSWVLLFWLQERKEKQSQ